MAHSLMFVQSLPLFASILCATLIGLVISFYYKHKNAHKFWSERGIRGPRPWPIVGNYVHLFLGNRMEHAKEWPQKYGKLYGVYHGLKPVLYVNDAEILHQICVKNFDVFANHELPEFMNRFHESFIFFQKDGKWKRLRALMSPTFTSGKIKRMFRLLDVCADDLIASFQEKLAPPVTAARVEVNVKDAYSLFAMNGISTCCYGLSLSRRQTNSDDDQETNRSQANRDDFLRLAQSLIEEKIWRLVVGVAGPKPLLRLIDFKMFEEGRFERLASMVQQLVSKRRESGQRKLEDYLQSLIDANLGDKMDLNEMDLEENHHAGLTRESLLSDRDKLVDDLKEGGSSSARQMLTEHEIVTNAMLLLLVGLETTATMLATCTYSLAFHPEIQEKLYEELAKIVEYTDEADKSHFTYEALTSCQYLDSVISETLRFLTPVFSLDRVASRDYRIEKYNLALPKGCHVSLAYYGIMNDPDYWPEPEKFDPERFMPGNKEKIVPGSYCPFGIGPRHCVGMRFSLTEGKLALAKTVMKFRFEPTSGAEFPPVLSRRVDFVGVADPTVVLISRT